MSMSVTALSGKQPKWQYQLSPTMLVNWAAISANGSRLVADTYFFPYPGTNRTDTHGTFGIYCFDSAVDKPRWFDEYEGDEGVFSVAISGDGQVAAAGGLYSGGQYSDRPDSGMLRAYDANTGKRLLDYMGIRRRVNSMALSADGAVLAAVSANKLYVFLRRQDGSFPIDPSIMVSDGQFLDGVAVHPTGDWIVACDRGGNVYLVTVANGAVGGPFRWKAPVVPPMAPPIQFLTVAIAATKKSFVVGGGNVIYLLTKDGMIAGTGPIAQYTPTDTGAAAPQTPSGAKQNVRWLAISDDGTFVTVVENLTATTGLLRALSLKANGQLDLAPGWTTNPVALNRNPNSTSMDLATKYVTVADGNPVGTAGHFYLFDASNGTKKWEFETTNMNWPMFISADGSTIVAGSDNGNLYVFEP